MLPIELIQHVTQFLDIQSYFVFDQTNKYIRGISKPLDCPLEFVDLARALRNSQTTIVNEMIKSRGFKLIDFSHSPIVQCLYCRAKGTELQIPKLTTLIDTMVISDPVGAMRLPMKTKSDWRTAAYFLDDLIFRLIAESILKACETQEAVDYIMQHPYMQLLDHKRILEDSYYSKWCIVQHWIHHRSLEDVNVEEVFILACGKNDQASIKKLLSRSETQQPKIISRGCARALYKKVYPVFRQLRLHHLFDINALEKSDISWLLFDAETYSIFQLDQAFADKLIEYGDSLMSPYNLTQNLNYIRLAHPEEAPYWEAANARDSAAMLRYIDASEKVPDRLLLLPSVEADIFRVLIQRGADPTILNSHYLSQSLYDNVPDIFELIAKHPKVDINTLSTGVLSEMLLRRGRSFSEAYFSHPNLNIGNLIQQVQFWDPKFWKGSHNGRPRLKTSIFIHAVLRYARHWQVTTDFVLLLRDQRSITLLGERSDFDPTQDTERVILNSIQTNNFHLLSLVLKDQRVKPTEQNILLAAKLKRWKILAQMLHRIEVEDHQRIIEMALDTKKRSIVYLVAKIVRIPLEGKRRQYFKLYEALQTLVQQ
ncbi:hypothetical protein EDD86DRAFT_247404 [Gorgonomyces haynaldii]|nr:hypothetical protein EDD86DRAFT_247404 [Gorgonomyces haynaldii]